MRKIYADLNLTMVNNILGVRSQALVETEVFGLWASQFSHVANQNVLLAK
jgi:hypothetical protein